MGRQREVEPGEIYDDDATKSSPEHAAFVGRKSAVAGLSEEVGISRLTQVWTCAANAFKNPTAGKCQSYFYIVDPIPKGWWWSEVAGYVSYMCPGCRNPDKVNVKTFAEGWNDYKTKVVSAKASLVQIDETRAAFYGGALQVIAHLRQIGAAPSNPTQNAADEAKLEKLYQEIVAFFTNPTRTP